jgi:hypothetical protein
LCLLVSIRHDRANFPLASHRALSALAAVCFASTIHKLVFTVFVSEVCGPRNQACGQCLLSWNNVSDRNGGLDHFYATMSGRILFYRWIVMLAAPFPIDHLLDASDWLHGSHQFIDSRPSVPMFGQTYKIEMAAASRPTGHLPGRPFVFSAGCLAGMLLRCHLLARTSFGLKTSPFPSPEVGMSYHWVLRSSDMVGWSEVCSTFDIQLALMFLSSRTPAETV